MRAANPQPSSSLPHFHIVNGVQIQGSVVEFEMKVGAGDPHCTPVLGRLTSTFGWREHPVEGGSKFHYGVDLAANTKTAV